MLKHRDWEREIVPELSGSNDALKVVLYNLPCLRDPDDGTRKLPFDDFDVELMEKLCSEQLADIEQVRALLSTGTKTMSVHLRDLPAVVVHITGRVSANPEQFYADLADCLVNALRTERILH